MQTSILSTKMYIPRVRDKSVMRKSLVEKISRDINSFSKVTLVSAPAGYGKTTLISELIDYMGIKSAWVSLDGGDNDPVIFLSYFIEALKGAGIGMGSDAKALLTDLSLSSNQSIITMIINDINAYSNRLILVLDDFHLISSPQVYDSVKFLIEHQPLNLHLVLITREDPRLPLSRLRALGHLTEIRIDDLRFTRDEVEEFLKSTMGLDIEAEAAMAFTAKTEGWAAGLQLAALSLRGCDRKGINTFIEEFNGTHRYIIDYLVEEVLGNQRREVRDFLCKTSILNSMNGELCDALTGGKDSSAVLQELEQENLFIVPLDGKREWYRYHHLFQDSLRAELTKSEEQLLHKRAALWLEANGFKEEAVGHGLESDDMTLALRLIIDNTEEMFASARLSTLLGWMEALPEELVRDSEILSVRKAWTLLIVGRVDAAVEYLNSLGEDFIENTTLHNKGLALSLRALVSQYRGMGEDEELAKKALELLEAWDPISRISTLNTLGRARENRGKSVEAVDTFKSAYKEGLMLGYTFITTLALMNLGTSLNKIGKRKETIQLYREYIDGMTRKLGKPLPYIGVIYVSLAAALYDGNDLEGADYYINMGMELCRSISYNWTQSSEALAGKIENAMGNRDRAIDIVEEAIKECSSKGQQLALFRNISALIQILISNGMGKRAVQYEQSLKNYIASANEEFNEEVYISYIRLLIYEKKINEALELLEKALLEMGMRQNIKALITINILYAKVCHDTMDNDGAAMHMDRAISLAEPGEYYRLLLDEGAFIYDAFNSTVFDFGEFGKKLLDYLKLTAEGNGPLNKKETGKRIFSELDFTESLSQREIEILKLLGRGMTNSDIAKQLFISINTTQWHISHIYSKLKVKNRTQAIIKAEELGII